ncbi:MAG: PQQ-dependent sugar dehydrogenase [Pseudonocardiaceae bacterium]
MVGHAEPDGFVTFHPGFAKNGEFYTVHTEAGQALAAKTPHLPAQDRTVVHGVLIEWTAADPSARTFGGTRREVLRLAFGSLIHGIQEIGFNPTAKPGDDDYGLLYIAVGDGGNGVGSDDPQKLGIPQGKILRIDPLGTNGAGGHYRYPLPEDDEQHGYTYPVVAYDHDPPPGWPCTRDSGHAVIGGFVYRGDGMPDLRGKYVFGDGVDGRIFYADAAEMRRGAKRLATVYEFLLLDGTGRQVTMHDLAGDSRVDLRFGSDGAGELYILAKANGKIWKVTGARRVR